MLWFSGGDGIICTSTAPRRRMQGKTMNKCKITVLKRTFDQELADQYGAKGLTACPMLGDGQTFHADFACHEGFCNEAWKAIYQYVFALAHGAGNDGSLFLLRRLDTPTGCRHL